LNVVAICVNYLQSGRKASIEDPQPYDCGYLQSLDALRALWFVRDGLKKHGRPFDAGRVYCTGGSGGGNVTLMAAKLAPRTFACIIDMCGMKKLSHDIAFNLPGGTGLNARWSRDPKSTNYLSVDEQEIRFVGHPDHLREHKRLGSPTKIIVVHGVDDGSCLFADAEELVRNLQFAGLDVDHHFITKDDLDGKVFTSSGHALGNRTEIVFRVAGDYLSPTSDKAIRHNGVTDFDRREDIRFRTTNGQFFISYEHGYPVGRFESHPASPVYNEHQDLSYYLDNNGQRKPISNPSDWRIRHKHILTGMQIVMGKLPAPTSRPPLDVQFGEKVEVEKLWRQKLTYLSDPFDRVPAWLLYPRHMPAGEKLPAVLCLHQTTKAGKDEPAGLTGNANMHYALEIARRGYIVLAPDYPSLGEHTYNFATNPEYASGTMKAIWDNIRAVDLLQSLPQVDANRIAVVGHSLGGHNAMFTAAFEPRIKVIVSSCGFTRFHKDDVPSWTGQRYMPRIASVYANNANRVPFDFTEVVSSFAPRPFLAVAATEDRDFDVSGVRDVITAAKQVYSLLGHPEHLQAEFPEGPHDFSPDARRCAYEFLDRHLRRK
jgi:cephalosporin-C deacetylase-like acetyl esterase